MNPSRKNANRTSGACALERDTFVNIKDIIAGNDFARMPLSQMIET
jgi:hypothetical protein